MSSEPARGHVPPLALGRYRMVKRAEQGAIAAARELANVGRLDLALTAREGARVLHAEAHAMRVALDDADAPGAT